MLDISDSPNPPVFRTMSKSERARHRTSTAIVRGKVVGFKSWHRFESAGALLGWLCPQSRSELLSGPHPPRYPSR